MSDLALSDFLLARIAEVEASVAVSMWKLIQTYCDDTGATEASILRRAGLNKGTFSAWRARGVPELPGRDQIMALADAIKVDYATLLEGILYDAQYLPERAQPARVLARCEADRMIVDLHEQVGGFCTMCGDVLNTGLEVSPAPCLTLRALALPYADHPGYREQWQP